MVRRVRLALFLCLFTLGFGGCASLPMLVALDVMNVAETGKTGYDMATGLSARRSLDQEVSPDAQAEARLRAALDSQGGLLKYATPHVSQGQGYVVGTYGSPQELERARKATQNITGVTQVTLCLFPAGSSHTRGVTDGEMRDNILRLSGVRTRDVRVHVVEGNAVLIGRVRTKGEQTQLADSARIAGATSVRNYVRFMAVR